MQDDVFWHWSNSKRLGKECSHNYEQCEQGSSKFFHPFIELRWLLTTRPQLSERRIIYPLDSAIGFPKTYPLDRDLSGGYRYPAFEQQGPGEPRLKISLYKSWENLAAGQSFRRNLTKDESELIKLRQSCSWKQVHKKKIQNGQKCETHGSEFYTEIFWELKRRRRGRRWWKRLLKKWVEAVEKFIAFIPCGSICLLLVSFSTVEFYRLYLSLKRIENRSLEFTTSTKRENWNVLRRGRATTTKKCKTSVMHVHSFHTVVVLQPVGVVVSA